MHLLGGLKGRPNNILVQVL